MENKTMSLLVALAWTTLPLSFSLSLSFFLARKENKGFRMSFQKKKKKVKEILGCLTNRLPFPILTQASKQASDRASESHGHTHTHTHTQPMNHWTLFSAGFKEAASHDSQMNHTRLCGWSSSSSFNPN